LGATAFPSITLNPVVGGFSPMAVEAAARQGAKVLYMPTWGATADIRRGSMSRYLHGFLETSKALTPERGLTVVDGDGRIHPEVSECLAIAAEFDMMVGTGHISPQETLTL